MTTQTSSNWRSRFRVHPAAELFPMMTDEELAKQCEDIKDNGLKLKIDVRRIDDLDIEVLDGRNRLEAMERAGIDIDPDIHFNEMDLDDAGAVLHVMSMNVHRRHLKPEQKRQVIAALLKADPANSNRQIAKIAKADDKTVAAQRAEWSELRKFRS